eukprot:g10493.t1
MSVVPFASKWWPLGENLIARGGGSPLFLFDHQDLNGNRCSGLPEWVPYGSLIEPSSGSPIYTFESQFAPHQEPGLFAESVDQVEGAPRSAAAADVAFLRGLDVDGLEASHGAASAPVRRLMISPATASAGESDEGGKHPPYDESYQPTPATLIADLKATTKFRSIIPDLNNDGSRGPLPYLLNNDEYTMDEVHEDENEQYIFSTLEELNEEEQPDDVRQHHARSLAVLAALKQYVLKERVFFMVIHTERWEDEELPGFLSSTDVVLLALGVSGASGNLVGVMAIQTCHNLCN